MAIEVQKNQNENITPFWEYYISYAREVSEQRNVEKELNDKKNLEEIIKQKAKETITNEY